MDLFASCLFRDSCLSCGAAAMLERYVFSMRSRRAGAGGAEVARSANGAGGAQTMLKLSTGDGEGGLKVYVRIHVSPLTVGLAKHKHLADLDSLLVVSCLISCAYLHSAYSVTPSSSSFYPSPSSPPYSSSTSRQSSSVWSPSKRRIKIVC